MIIKTTKEIGIDLHSDNKEIVEFEFSYERDKNGLRVRVQPFAPQMIMSMGDKPIEVRQPIKGAETVRMLNDEQLEALIEQVTEITEPNDNPFIYMDNLVANGIKVIIISEGLWKGALTITDFE